MQRSSGYRQDPPGNLKEAAFCLLALVKLGRFSAAEAELKALGDLKRPEHSFEGPYGVWALISQTRSCLALSSWGLNGGLLSGLESRVPFMLELLACVIPSKLDRWRESQEAFYALLETCTQNAERDISGAGELPALGFS